MKTSPGGPGLGGLLGGRGSPHPHFPLAGAEVEVQAALEALVDEAGVGGHRSQAPVLLGHEVQLPLGRLLLLPGQFLRDGGDAGSAGPAGALGGEVPFPPQPPGRNVPPGAACRHEPRAWTPRSTLSLEAAPRRRRDTPLPLLYFFIRWGGGPEEPSLSLPWRGLDPARHDVVSRVPPPPSSAQHRPPPSGPGTY